MLRPSPSSTRAVATTPAEAVGARVARFSTAGSLPQVIGGSASASPVSGPARRSLALRPAWSLTTQRGLVVGVLQPMSLPPSSAPTATGWSDSCRAGFAPAEERRLSRRTTTERLPLDPWTLDVHRPGPLDPGSLPAQAARGWPLSPSRQGSPVPHAPGSNPRRSVCAASQSSQRQRTPVRLA